MAAFSNTAFDTGAFSVNAFDFGSTPAPPAPTPTFGTAPWIAPLRRFEDLPGQRFLRVRKLIEEVAVEQVKHLELDEQQRLEHLARELEAENLEFEASYLEALNLYREQLIGEEISRLIKRRRNDDEAILLILIAAYFT